MAEVDQENINDKFIANVNSDGDDQWDENGVDVVGTGTEMIKIEPMMPDNTIDKQPLNMLERPDSNMSDASSRKGKLRVVLQLNINTKPTATFPPTPEPDIPNLVGAGDGGQPPGEPISVTLEYPEDLAITIKAQVQRLDHREEQHSEVILSKNTTICSAHGQEEEDMDESTVRGWKDTYKKDVVDASMGGGKKVLNSTFVRPAFSSTLIYPILEENEDGIKDLVLEFEQQNLDANATLKSGSGGSSIYKTVLADNDVQDEFENISAIVKTDAVVHEKATEDSLGLDYVKNPSLTLSSKSKISQAENLTSAEKLVQALHVMARYRGVWGIYEDDSRIVKNLIKLNELLSETDKETVYKTCRDDEYQELKGLISYFILEKRFVIRSQLLHTFSLLSQKSSGLGHFIFESDIPVVLARDIISGDYTTKETCDYAFCFLQLIACKQLSKKQCECIGSTFYYHLIEKIHCAQKHYYGRMADMLFDILLSYHEQLGAQEELKVNSLFYSGNGNRNRTAMQKIKEKVINYFLKMVSCNDGDADNMQQRKGKLVLTILNDWIVCKETRELFNDAELDILLVSLTHNLEQNRLSAIQFEAVKTMHRILRCIRIEPSGMDNMLLLIEQLLLEDEVLRECDYDKNYRILLTKIFKILSTE